MNEAENPREADRPAPQLEYATPLPALSSSAGVIVDEADDRLVVLIPQRPLWRVVVPRTILLLVVGGVAFGMLDEAITSWRSISFDLCFACGILCGAAVVAVAIHHIALAARYGRRPAVIIISRQSLMLEDPLSDGDRVRTWPLSEIRDITVDSSFTVTLGCQVLITIVVKSIFDQSHSLTFLTRQHSLPRRLRELFNKHLKSP